MGSTIGLAACVLLVVAGGAMGGAVVAAVSVFWVLLMAAILWTAWRRLGVDLDDLLVIAMWSSLIMLAGVGVTLAVVEVG